MIKTWKGKSTDVLLVILYFLIYGIGFHIMLVLRQKRKHQSDFNFTLDNPFQYLLTFFLLFIFMSPTMVYFSKVPKMLEIDSLKRKLVLHKRSKKLGYNIDKIRYYKRETSIFFILEIHATFEVPQKAPFEKLATTIIVPNWGLSWNRKKMLEIVAELKALNVEEVKNRPQISISDYFYN